MKNPIRILASNKPEVHAYCQNIDAEKYYTARARWALDFSGLPALEVHLLGHVQAVARRERWRVPKDMDGRPIDIPKEFAGMAIAEIKYPTWFSFNAPEARNPQNARKASQRKRADWIGMHPNTYIKTWSGRYQDVYQILENYIDIFMRVTYRNQSEK